MLIVSNLQNQSITDRQTNRQVDYYNPNNMKYSILVGKVGKVRMEGEGRGRGRREGRREGGKGEGGKGEGGKGEGGKGGREVKGGGRGG